MFYYVDLPSDNMDGVQSNYGNNIQATNIIKMATNSKDLLDSLNQQIKHEGPQQTINEPAPPKAPPPTNKKKKGNKQVPLPIIPEATTLHKQPTNKEPQFQQVLREEQSHEPPECLVQILAKQVGQEISEGLAEVVESTIKQREKNTYQSLTSDNSNFYIQAMLNNAKKKNQSNVDFISNIMENRHSKVEGDFFSGQIEIIPDAAISTKKQLQFLSKLDLARMIKIKEGELRTKMDVLQQKISNLEEVESWNGVDEDQQRLQRELHRRISESMDANNYSLDSEKTKIARNYVRHMNRQRKLFEKRKNEREHRYEEASAERESEMQEALQMKDLAKRQEIIERIEQRRKKREQEEEQIQTKEKEVQSFLSEFHPKSPLFKQKERQFIQKFVKPEARQRQEKLNEIRQNRKSMSLNQIRSHEETYLSNLKLDRAKREDEFKLILKSRKAEDQSKIHYKGQAHKRIGQMTKETEKKKQALMQASKLKAMRMKQYSDIILDKHKPKIDQNKKEQLHRYVENDMLLKNKAKKVYKQVVDEETKEVKITWHYQPLPSRDRKSEGNKYFLQAKKMAKKRKEQTQSQHNDRPEELKSSRQAPGSLHLIKKSDGDADSKLKDIWSARSKQLKEYADLEVVDAKNFQYVKHNIQNLDKKAEKREFMLKQLNLSIPQHIQNKGMLDQFYLQSIRQKIKLLQ